MFIGAKSDENFDSVRIRKPDQVIQPWQFVHGETKATCLWLKGLPKLVPTNIVEGREAKVHRMPPSPNRWMERSRTYLGIANAMAKQYSLFVGNSEAYMLKHGYTNKQQQKGDLHR